MRTPFPEEEREVNQVGHFILQFDFFQIFRYGAIIKVRESEHLL